MLRVVTPFVFLLAACAAGVSDASAPAVAQPVERAQPLPPPLLENYGGDIVQAGLSFWRTESGSVVSLNNEPVAVDADGHFTLGFGVNYEGTADLRVVLADGRALSRTLNVRDRAFPTSEVTNLPSSKVQPRTEEQLAKIAADREIKLAARSVWTDEPHWRTGWIWPITGRISTQMGSYRTLNGVPQSRPHSGVDVARVRGTPWEDFHGKDIVAPADGLVTLAETDLYFEGGTIFLDHGHRIESAMLHLSRVDVRPGDLVRKGDVIGAVGMTGRSSGPHLHWTINWHGTPIDPALLVPPMEDVQN